LSELETAIAVAGTLGGTLGGLLLGYLLNERTERNRLRRETALKPLEQKIPAMLNAYNALAELTIIVIKSAVDPQSHNSTLQGSVDRFDTAILQAAIWMMNSPKNMDRMVESQLSIRTACDKLLSGESLSDAEFKDNFSAPVGTLGNVIGTELGIPDLGNQLQKFGLGVKP
jgi:hypothetical protein